MDPRPVAASEQWLAGSEKGSSLGIRFVATMVRLFGRGFGRLWLRPIAFYYVVFAGSVRRASQSYLRRVGVEAGFWASYRHVLTFAECTLDRLFHAAGNASPFEIEHHGNEHLRDLGEGEHGALLLGGHLGSFEAMRNVGSAAGKRVNILAHFDNAKKITAFLRATAPDFDGRVIAVQPDRPQFILQVAECIEAGEFVAMLGDRVGLGGPSTPVQLLGGEVEFPLGPYALASTLGCPILLTVALYHPPHRYALYCEPLASAQDARDARRDPQAQARLAQRFADRLAHFCKLAPLNWFNFYEMWR